MGFYPIPKFLLTRLQLITDMTAPDCIFMIKVQIAFLQVLNGLNGLETKACIHPITILRNLIETLFELYNFPSRCIHYRAELNSVCVRTNELSEVINTLIL